jgi:hypothetical protein
MSPSNRIALISAAGISLSLLLLARLFRKSKNRKKSKPEIENWNVTKRAGSRQQGVRSPSGRVGSPLLPAAGWTKHVLLHALKAHGLAWHAEAYYELSLGLEAI